MGKSTGDFHLELKRRLAENRRLYRDGSPFVVFHTPFAKFIASSLGVNPWKVLLPLAVLIVVFFRILFGRGFSELVLRVLGG